MNVFVRKMLHTLGGAVLPSLRIFDNAFRSTMSSSWDVPSVATTVGIRRELDWTVFARLVALVHNKTVSDA